MTRKPMSEEQKQIRREAAKRQWAENYEALAEAVRKNITAYNQSEEARAKTSARLKGRRRSPQSRRKISEGLKRYHAAKESS